MYNMIINNFDSATIPFCYVTDFGRVQTASPKIAESTIIYGANGSYDVLDGAYKSYERTFSFYLAKLSDIETLVDKFRDEENILVFGYQPDSYFYADFIEASYTPNGRHAWSLEVKVKMYPFRYIKDLDDIILLKSGSVTNPGTIYSEPIIEIEGQGAIALTIGKQTMHLTIQGIVTIDCRHGKQNVYGADGNLANTLRKRGPFFEIPTGISGVIATGDVTKIKIKGNWRYKV